MQQQPARGPVLAHSQSGPVLVNDIPKEAISYGLKKAKKPFSKSFVSAIFAGAFIALAFIFYITVTTGSQSSWGVTHLLGGLAFSLGLILVVVCGTELFTSTILSTHAWRNKKITTQTMLKCWLQVFMGNFVGALFMLGLVLMAGLYQLDHGEWGLNAIHIAQHKLHHGWWQAFALGTLCNLLVCLGVWMTLSQQDNLTKAMLLILPVAMFVSTGFEHSIANLFMVPLGISLRHLAEAGLYTVPHTTLAALQDLNISQFLIHNLIPVVLGNIAGGSLLLGLGSKLEHEKTSTQIPLIQGKPTMTQLNIASKTVSDVCNAAPLAFTSATSLFQAIESLCEHNVRCAPVVTQQNDLLGIVTEQDLLRYLWAEEFSHPVDLTVGDMMQRQVLTVNPEDKLDAVIEFMCVDREKLFPVNSNGAYLGGAYNSYEERLQKAQSHKPSCYPVLKEGKLVGMLYREDLLKLVQASVKPVSSTDNEKQPEEQVA